MAAVPFAFLLFFIGGIYVWMIFLKTLIRALSAAVVGGLIGSERARHGQAAGMRTHILVCLGACMTAMTSVFAAESAGSGDIFRLSAQVVSGIGFLGAGIIILKPNNMITGLTTAAGVWTVGTIGVALGYGYYIGAAVVTVLFMIAVTLLSKVERLHKSVEQIYIEVDDLYKVNDVLKALESHFPKAFSYQVLPPKSGHHGHVGLSLAIDKTVAVDIEAFQKINNIVFAIEE